MKLFANGILQLSGAVGPSTVFPVIPSHPSLCALALGGKELKPQDRGPSATEAMPKSARSGPGQCIRRSADRVLRQLLQLLHLVASRNHDCVGSLCLHISLENKTTSSQFMGLSRQVSGRETQGSLLWRGMQPWGIGQWSTDYHGYNQGLPRVEAAHVEPHTD